jgi:transcriptional regulator with XRE-family HTH domain
MTGRQVRRYRTDPWRPRRMSAEQLAAAVTGLGLPYTRAQVTNLEAGRRNSITVGEVLAIAAVLEVPPLLLIFPFGDEQAATYLPGKTADTWDAAQWFTGDTPMPAYRDSPEGPDRHWSQRFNRYSRPVALYRQHDRYIADWRRRIELGEDRNSEHVLSAEEMLEATREHMRARGITPPTLPDELTHIEQETAQ